MSMRDHIESSKRSGEIEFFFEERDDEHVISRMVITDGVRNPFGTVQAGAMIWLADVTASVLVLEKHGLGEEGAGFPLAVDLHTTLLANQRDGEVRAEARFVRAGRRLYVVRTRVTGNDGRLLAEVTTTHVPASGAGKK
jgi:uncharacterized protein (TIGR00369 family)